MMDTEIELKLFVPAQLTDLLKETLNNIPGATTQGSHLLVNKYFDTETLVLRQLKMGLRVRKRDAYREQTIKTAGKVVGGIHSRPEYNVEINVNEPELSLFPAHIWPETVNINSINSQLKCIFETNFTRHTWHIYIQDSLIEIAFDEGNVIAGQLTDPICELELELLAGDANALLQLATDIAKSVPLRLGKASKAQRGYFLAGKSQAATFAKIGYIALPTDKSLDKTLTTLLETGLERWQLIESILIDTSDIHQQGLLWSQLRACVRLLRMTLSQFGLLNQQVDELFDLLESDFSFIPALQAHCLIVADDGSLLAKSAQKSGVLTSVEQHIEQQQYQAKLAQIWQQAHYGQLQLALVELLLNSQQGRHQLVNYPELGLFANLLQQDSWKRIVDLMPQQADMSIVDYRQVEQALDESILVGFAYGELYLSTERETFRAPWQDLALGITTLHAYQCLRQLSHEQQLDLESWLSNKESSLLLAMEHSRKSALNVKPYWK
ncbi:inorganic triphosphatase [Shewanella intestini]|uniref:CYTH domain-containing protein n=1 Tax=Shewanella intestini TaxID=2017544 RepID=A0ABS5I588_9GAMM|nr:MULTISPECIES: CYTH domain-containing protein [Shewanella]MBR9729188.1 CYTH domain-containing protein [Shewanella intestini]MRG37241.1 CYTH domain-containing protein [Shewanella sp. XMDDZSB0408]